MKLLKNIFDSSRHHFEKGGKFERMCPLFDATETAFFAPADVTRIGPHVRDSLDVKRFMVIVLMTLMPLLAFGIYNTGYYSRLASGLSLDFFHVMMTGSWVVLPIVIVSYMVGFSWEILFAVVRKHSISEGFFVTAMLFPLTLPPTIPLWQVAVGISFGVVIGKEIFGGTGRNFLNPALTGRAFLFFAYPSKMSGDIWIAIKDKAIDGFSGATPLAVSAATEVYEKIEFSLAKAGFTLSNLFWGHRPGSIGETSVFLCLIGVLVLIIVGIASYRIVIGGIIGVLATGHILNLLAAEQSSPWMHLNPIYHLLMGGFAFGLAFMATEPVTAPHTDNAKWIYGLCIGALTVLIRVFNPAYTEGVMLSILFMNVFAPLLDHIELSFRLKRRIPNV